MFKIFEGYHFIEALHMQKAAKRFTQSSVSMMLPISTPPNAIAHSTGIVQQSDMIKVGAIMGAVGLVAGVAWLMLVF